MTCDMVLQEDMEIEQSGFQLNFRRSKGTKLSQNFLVSFQFSNASISIADDFGTLRSVRSHFSQMTEAPSSASTSFHPGSQGAHPGSQGGHPGSTGGYPGSSGLHPGSTHLGQASSTGGLQREQPSASALQHNYSNLPSVQVPTIILSYKVPTLL